MSLFLLCNTVNLGGRILKAGTIVNDVVRPTAPITSAGGKLVAYTAAASQDAFIAAMLSSGQRGNPPKLDDVLANALVATIVPPP